MNNAIVKLGFCFLFFCAAVSAYAANPTVTVIRKAATPNPTRAGSVVFVVEFNALVDGFGDAATDYAFSGTAGTATGVSASITTTLTANKKFEVTVTGLTVTGTVGLDIAAGAATAQSDSAPNTVSTGSQTFTFDGDPDTDVSRNGSPSPSVNTNIVRFTVDFGEEVTDFDASAIDFTGSGTSMSGLTVDHITETTPGEIWDVYILIDETTAVKGEDIVVSVAAGTVHDAYGNGNKDDSSTIQYGGVAPTVSNTSITSTESTFTLSGEVTFDGGDAGVKRGTVWKQGSAASATDNKTQQGTGDGTFTQLRNDGSIQNEKLYFVTAYADNGNGGVILATPQLQIWTLSHAPDDHSDVTLSNVTTNSISVAFEKFSTITHTKGIVILRKQDNPITAADLPNGKAPTLANIPLMIELVTNGNQTSLTTNPNTGLTPGTKYYYAAVPFNWDNTHPETYNYLSTFTQDNATTAEAKSRIRVDSAPATLAYINETGTGAITDENGGIVVASMTVVDGDGSINDGDNLPTNIETLTIHVENFEMVNHIAILDGTSTIHDEGTLDASGNITFHLSTGDLNTLDNNAVGSGSPDDFKLIASFNTTTIDEGARIKITVTGVTVFPGSSQMLNGDGGNEDTGDTKNIIEVTATKLEFSGLAPATINPNNDFSLTVTALDANNKVDKNLNGTVKLTKTAGGGAFASTDTPGGDTRTLVNGTTSWAHLQLDEAGTKTLSGHHSSGSITDKTIDVTVISLGINLSNATTAFCFNSTSTNTNTYATLDPIVITEQDKSDFGIGDNQTLALILPAGFVFDVTTMGSVVVTGSDVDTDPTKAKSLGFNASKNIVRIQYDVNSVGGTNKDKITISGLKVKYIDKVAIAPSPIVRVGGSAVIAGSLEDDATKPFATLTTAPGSIAVSFLNEVQAGITDTQTTFSRGSTAATLQGVKSLDTSFDLDGVFTGEGIGFESGRYKFFPATVDDGPHDLTFTFSNPNIDTPFGQVGCITDVQKTYTVYSTIINGLNPSYCVNAAPAALGAPTSSTPNGGICIASGLPVYDGTHKYKYQDRVTGWTDLPSQTAFDPSNPAFADEIAADHQVTIGVFYIWVCTPFTFEDLWYQAPIQIFDKPAISFTTNPATPDLVFGICANAADRDLTGTPYSPGTGYDEFWVSEVGSPSTVIAAGTIGSRATGFKFSPSGANPTGVDKDIQINYRHQDPDPLVACTNQISQVVSVFRKPPVVPTAKIFARGIADISAEFCQSEPISAFSIDNPTSTSYYKWYDATGVNQVTTEGSVSFNPTAQLPSTLGVPDVGTTTFNVSQTENRLAFGTLVFFNGCESDKVAMTVEVFAPAVVQMNPTQVPIICDGTDLLVSSLVPSITPSALGGKWTSLHPTNKGEFRDVDDLVENDFGEAVYYHPSTQEYAQGFIDLQLESLDPAGPCGIIVRQIQIRVNPGVNVSFPVSPVRVCAADQLFVDGKVTNAPSFTWEVDTGGGTIDPATADKNQVTYRPNATEINQGGSVKLKLTAADPDDTGPCEPVSQLVQVNIDQPARIEAGPDKDYCAGQPIVVTGNKPAGLSSATTWTWSTNGAAGDAGIVNVNALSTMYNPSPTEDPGAQDAPGSNKIVFTITSDAPGLGNVCPGVSDDVEITVHFKPTAPVLESPEKKCVNDPIPLLKAVPKPNSIITWYDNDPIIDPTSQIATGASISTGVTSLVEKKVPFWATQTFDRVQNGFVGCESNSSTVTIVVNPNPVPYFGFANQCFGSIMQFTDGSTVAQRAVGDPDGPRSITAWKWNFDDNLGDSPEGGPGVPIPDGTHDSRTTETFDNPGHVFKNTGLYNVLMTITTSDGCKASFLPTSAIEVGPIPVANFDVVKLCEDDQTKYTYTGTESASINSYEWDFGDPSSGGDNTVTNIANPEHLFTGVGTYDVTLTVSTNLHCESTFTQKTSIYPYIKNFPYIEDFETTNHGWVPDGRVFDGSNVTVATSWNLLTSAGDIDSDTQAEVGPTFWATHQTGLPDNFFYYNNERSVLYGPCVDMSALERPVLSMDYANDIEPLGDGAYLEYREETDAGVGTWTRLGDNTHGLNWYNLASIGGLALLGDVGQNVSQFGWSDSLSVWKSARYNLDPLVGKSRVRFRVVFGSNFNSVNTADYSGFAFDYFKIESRNRLVLVENFTSNSTLPAVATNSTAFNEFPNGSASDKVVKIEYHTGLPAKAGDDKDPIFLQNPMDPNARASFYGLSAVPRGYIDGYTNVAGSGAFNDLWASDYYSRESLKTSPISINVDKPTITDGVLTITGNVVADQIELRANNYSLYIAVVEESVGTDSYVLRKMLPSAAGFKVPGTARGSSFTFEQSWSIDKNSLSADPKLMAIAFVQSDIVNADNERLVLQAAFNNDIDDISFTTGLEIPFLEQTALYPNPADRIATIELPEPTKSGVEVSVFDQVGRPVIKSAIGIGQRSVAINTSDLTAAMYIVQLRENGVFTTRKLVITHSQR